MEETTKISGLKVRIAVIQSTKTVEFQVNQPYKLVNKNGATIRTGKGNVRSCLQIKSSRPANIIYQIRLAKVRQKRDAGRLIQDFSEKQIRATTRQVGELITFKNHAVDNREYWIVSGEFETHEQAEKAQTLLADTEDNTIIEKITVKPYGKIRFEDEDLGEVVRIVPESPEDARITIYNVMVGIEFHWQRLEAQDYRGIVEVSFSNDGQLSVINEVDIEHYLISVNSSEMTPDCPMDLLKAQTVAARSTILATMGKHHYSQNFHLCADDHCQCYRGTTYEKAASIQAIQDTLGEVLLFEDEICDARYAKICGGVMESYENVWEEKKIPYLSAGVDGEIEIDTPLDTEEKARAFIDSEPKVYCNTELHELPKMLDYANRLFRWRVTYRRQELADIIRAKTNDDIGQLIDIIPLARGISGRIKYIEIVGSKKTLKIKRELAIRRILSRSHLYSSCFYVEKTSSNNGKVDYFTFVGAGWGHGVGLCQVGATIMAKNGFSYRDILNHYYKGACILKLY